MKIKQIHHFQFLNCISFDRYFEAHEKLSTMIFYTQNSIEHMQITLAHVRILHLLLNFV